LIGHPQPGSDIAAAERRETASALRYQPDRPRAAGAAGRLDRSALVLGEILDLQFQHEAHRHSVPDDGA
jgi:hypothetical protein